MCEVSQMNNKFEISNLERKKAIFMSIILHTSHHHHFCCYYCLFRSTAPTFGPKNSSLANWARVPSDNRRCRSHSARSTGLRWSGQNRLWYRIRSSGSMERKRWIWDWPRKRWTIGDIFVAERFLERADRKSELKEEKKISFVFCRTL